MKSEIQDSDEIISVYPDAAGTTDLNLANALNRQSIPALTSRQKKKSERFDKRGSYTGDYAQYLWEQQQMEEAKNSLVEDAMREQYEEDLEPHIFPLD